MRTRVSALLGLAVGLALLAGCVPTQPTSTAPSSGTSGTSGTAGTGASTGVSTAAAPTTAAALADLSMIASDWAGSAHANVVLLPTTLPGCVECHDGGAFAKGITDPKQLKRDVGPETSATSFPVSTDCRACHTGRGADFIKSGTVSIPSTSNITAGAGAVCMACHNERVAPNIDSTTYVGPHVGPEAPVLVASGGIRVGVIDPGSTTKHAHVNNTCVACHMQDVNGVPSHTFKVTSLAPCAKCHPGITTPNMTSKGDYDGNGKIEGLQTEVMGLTSAVTSAAVKASKATTMTEVGGNIVFKSGTTTVTPLPKNVYAAAYNVALVEADKSWGVHNPQFVVDLLQQSYQQVTGKPLPGAAPFK